jgi:hypothetical protein
MYNKERIHLVSKILRRSIPQKAVHVPNYDGFEQEKTIDLYSELLDTFENHENFKILEIPNPMTTKECRRDSVEEAISFFKENLENGKSVGFYSVNVIRVNADTLRYNIRCSIS